jgi:hypothetical protein
MPCRDLVKTVFGNVATRVVRTDETASLEEREIQQVPSILVRAVEGRLRS